MKKILIIGLGLIGSSIALGIKRAHPDFEILGSDRENIQEIAQKRGIIDSKVGLVEGAQKVDFGCSNYNHFGAFEKASNFEFKKRSFDYRYRFNQE